MSRIVLRGLLALWLLAGTAPAAFALDASTSPASATLSGDGLSSTVLTRETLSVMPTVSMDVAFMTAKGEEKGRFEGVSLWEVLKKAGILNGAGHHDELRRAFLVTGRDGYAILFSVGEIEPDFGATPAMIALKRDGEPLPPEDGLRLIVPGDTRGARNVKDVVTIEVR